MLSFKKLGLAVLTTVAIVNASSTAKAEIIDVSIKTSQNTVIRVKDEINQLPIEKISFIPSKLTDYKLLLQEKQKNIYKKISSVTDINKEYQQKEFERLAQEAKKAEEAKQAEEAKKAEDAKNAEASTGSIQYGSDGLLIMEGTGRAQEAVNRLLAIPGHSNGQAYHNNGLDDLINSLTTAEALWVIHRIEGAGFGQTGDGYAGIDTPASHRNFIQNQVNNRFGGSVHNLLRHWGTYSYGGY